MRKKWRKTRGRDGRRREGTGEGGHERKEKGWRRVEGGGAGNVEGAGGRRKLAYAFFTVQSLNSSG